MSNNTPLLEAKNLRISFKTINGTVKAVRGIDFQLYKGRTLGIVGESGSGKSVTSRAVMGILAGNKIVEDGQIIYDGKDLLSLSEEDFCKLRGRKISMIFQDPMSSLNPIMKIGNQLTETMFLKEASTAKEAKEYMNIFKKDFTNLKGKEVSKLIEAFESYYFDEAEFNRVKEVLNTLKERINLHLTTVVNENSYKAARFKEDVKEIKFLVKDSTNKFTKAAFADVTVKANVSEEAFATLVDGKEVKEFNDDVKVADVLAFANKVTTIKANRDIAHAIVAYNHVVFKNMVDAVEKFSNEAKLVARVEITPEQEKELNDLFVEAVAKEQERFENALKESFDLLTAVKEEHLTNQETFNVGQFKKALKKLKVAIANASYRYSDVKDSEVSIIANSLEALLANYVELVEFEEKQEKMRKKNGGSLELTVKQRAFLSEVNNGPEAAFAKMTAIADKGIEKLAKLIKNPPKYKAEDAKKLFEDSHINSVKTLNRVKANIRAISLMREVGISEPEKRIHQYPFEFSGGMRQRIVIAIALSSNPEILICDEPTTALDVTIQAQILDLINKLKAEKNLSVIFITHDLGVIANMADDIAVMYAGKIVEYGTCEDIFYNPQHPYTWALLASMPDLDTKDKLDAIPGTPPNMILPPKGDAFAARNKYALNVDLEEFPPFFSVSETHKAATWLLDKRAPKVEPPKIVVDRIQKAYNAMKKDKKLAGSILENPFINKKKGEE